MAHAHRTARGWLILLTVLLLAFVAAVVWVVVARSQGGDGATAKAVSQEDEAALGRDGWFTEDQASRGAEAYAEACASCHGPQLEGEVGPALTGDAFWERWGGETVHTFFEVTSQTMPQDDPGSLDLETYADITAHVLHVNDFPTGEDPLPPDEERLRELTIQEPGSDGQSEDAQAASEGNGEGEADEATEAGQTAPGDAEEDADGDAGSTSVGDAAEGSTDPGSEEASEGDPAAGADDERSTSAAEGGWFADAQVQAGRAIFAEQCARCHGNDLQGNPPLVGGGFPERYETVWGLYQYVQQTMPLDRPGSLRDQAYLDAVAYLLDENGYPVGKQHREPSRAVLLEMQLDMQPATGEREPTADGAAEDEDAPSADGEAGAEERGGAAADEGAGDDAGEGADGGEPDDGAPASDEGAATASGSGEDASAEGGSAEGGSAEGYYDQEQADRGQEAFAQHCAQCHGEDLQGQPPLIGDPFLGNHESVWDLYAYTRENMPLTDPGSLDDETYADIVAYLLSENDLPDGGAELGPDQEDAMHDLPLDPEAGDAGAQAEGDGDATESATPEESGSEGQAREPEAAEGESGEREGADADGGLLPALASLEIDARPANMTINILGPDGLARRAIGAQTLVDLQPGLYVVAGSRGHESTTVNVVVASGETARVRLVLDELSRSTDVPEDPAIPATEIPAIPRVPAEGVLIGEPPAAALGTARTGSRGATAPDTDFAAGRGQQAFSLHCARCHGDDLEGNVAPALGGDVFFERWGGHPVDWLYFQARAAMPPHGAGSLREQTYADIVVYLLTANGVLEGFESFTPGDVAFRTLVIERRQGADDLPALEDQVDRLRETLHGPQDDVEPTVIGPLLPIEWPDDLGIAPIGNEGDWLGPIGPADEPPGEDPVDEPDDETDDDEGRAVDTATTRRAA